MLAAHFSIEAGKVTGVHFGQGGQSGADGLYRELEERLLAYFSGHDVDFTDFELDWGRVGAFDARVLAVTRTIPWGQVRTYGWVARAIGQPRSTRAVGGALARNPFPIIVPCHRVIRSDGNIGGFGGGPELKVRLLRLEGVGVIRRRGSYWIAEPWRP